MKHTNFTYRFLYGCIRLSLFVSMCAIVQSLNGQVFQRFTEEEGLPINHITDIVQDKYGFMWIATEAGLVRFDGSRFNVFNHNPEDSLSISTNVPVKLDVAENGDIWIASDNGQLDRYVIEKGIFQRHKIEGIDSFIDNRVFTIHLEDYVVWLGVEPGLIKYTPNTREAEVFMFNDINFWDYVGNNSIWDIEQDLDDPHSFWLFSRLGLLKFNKNTGQKKYFPYGSDLIGSPPLRTGLIDSNVLWSGTNKSGLRRFDTRAEQWQYFVDLTINDPAGYNGISAIYPKSEDELWVTSWHRGFGVFDKKSFSYNFVERDVTNPYALQDGEMNSMYVDRDKNIWIEGNEGIFFYNPDMQYFHQIELPDRTITHDKTHNFPVAFERINETQALAGSLSGNGLYLLDLISGKASLVTDYVNADYTRLEKNARTKDLYSLDVQDLLKVDHNRIWVTMRHQFGYYDIAHNKLVFPESTNIFFFKNKAIRGLKLDNEGNMWGINSSLNTIFKCDGLTGEILETIELNAYLEEELPEARPYGVYDFAFHPDGTIWIISFQDVIIYSPRDEKFSYLPRKKNDQHGLEGKSFYNIDIDDKGNAYLSASLNGLQVINNDSPDLEDRFKLLTVNDGLPVNKIIRVQCSDGKVWLATRRGLVQYIPESEEVLVFGKSDGIPNIDLLNYWAPSLDVLDDGTIYFGNPDNVIWFNESDLYHNDRVPKVLISDFEIYSGKHKSLKHLHGISEIKLEADQNFFSVGFGMDDYTQPHKQSYRYRLVGYDEDWVEANRSRIAKYTRVPGGNYVLEIEGANSSGTWTSEPTKLYIYIATPFLKSNTFYALLALTIAALLFILYRYRIQQIREKDQILSDLNLKIAEAEMQALRAQMNPHFIFNSLNSINKFILTNDARTASRYLTKFSKLIRQILNNSKYKTIPLQDELNTLDIYVEMEQLRSSHGFDYECNLNLESNPLKILIPSMLIQPFVENAIWHGLMPLDKRGRITLNISQSHDLLYIIIDDNGIGRKKSAEIQANKEIKRDSKGLQITADRIRINDLKSQTNSNITIEDKYDNEGQALGTKVTIVLNNPNTLRTDG